MIPSQNFKPTTFWVSLAIGALLTSGVQANPNGGIVVNGQVVIDPSQAGVLNITNSPNAIINWNGFSINANEITRFIQQNSSSAVLNRVVGQDPSLILGQLLSNGRVFLINPNGIVFGEGSVVDTAGLLASTLNISNEDFLRGSYLFVNPGKGGIENYGLIRISNGGSVVLASPDIKNNGLIQSDGGHLVLAAGQKLTLASMENPQIRFEVQAPADKVLNIGQLMANGGGSVDVFAGSIQSDGVISANSVQVDQHGHISLVAASDVTLGAQSITSANGPSGGEVLVQSQHGTTSVSGAVEAVGDAGKGGSVQLLGERVGLFDHAKVNASGSQGGGTVLIGGDFQGKNPEVQNAQQTLVAPKVQIRADAVASGDGGTVITWSDLNTRFAGTISAKGGTAGGNGGFVEVSGKDNLFFGGKVDTGAPRGETGKLLLDPTDISIVSGATILVPCGLGGSPCYSDPTPTVWETTDDTGSQSINVGTLKSLLGSNNITLQASNGITWSSGTLNYASLVGKTLTLKANGTGSSAINISGSSAVGWSGGTASDNFTLKLQADNGGVAIANDAIAKGSGTTLAVEISAGSGGVTGTTGGAKDITADKLTVKSGGTVVLDTAVSNFSGSVTSGNFTMTNSGALTLDALSTSSLANSSIYVGSGSLTLTNAGTLSVPGSSSCSYSSCAALTANNDISVTTTGTGSHITSGSSGSSSFARSTNGGVSLTSGGDMTIGTSSNYMDIYADKGNISLSATGSVSLLGDTWLYSNQNNASLSNTISITANGSNGIAIGDSTSSSQPDIHTYGLGGITLSAPNGPITQYSGATITSDYGGTVSMSSQGNIQLSSNGISFTNTVGNITFSSGGTVSSAAALTANLLTLNGTGGVYNLSGLNNNVTSLAGSTGTVNFRDDNGFAITGLTTSGATTLISTGSVTQSGALSVGGLLTLSGTGGNYGLGGFNNNVASLNGDTGTVSFRDDNGFAITGLTTSGAATFSSSGSVTQSSALNVSGLLTLNGAGGAYSLAALGNNASSLSANTGSVSYKDTDGFTVTSFSTTGNATFQTLSNTIDFSGSNSVGGALSNTGNVRMLDGSLNVGGAFSNSAALTFANGSPLVITAGSISADTINLTNGSLSVEGTSSAPQQFSNAVALNSTGPITVNTLNLKGRLDSNGSITVNSAFNWNQGVIGGTGAALTTNGATAIDQNRVEITGGRVWNNAGTINASNTGLTAINLWGGSSLQNQGTLNLSGASFLIGGNTSGGITNKLGGVLNVASGEHILSIPFTNAGTVNVNGGALEIRSSGTDSGVYNVTNNAILDFVGADGAISRTFNGAINSSNSQGEVWFQNGTFTVNSGLNVGWAGVANTATVNIASGYSSRSTYIAGALNVAGAYTQLADGDTTLDYGTLTATSVTVNAGATVPNWDTVLLNPKDLGIGGFAGSGTVDLAGGEFVNNGGVYLWGGALVINGSYKQSSSGGLAVGLSSPAAFGFFDTAGDTGSKLLSSNVPGSLQVSGTAHVAGALRVLWEGADSTSHRVIDADGGLIGTFGSVGNYPSGLALSYTYDATGLTVSTGGLATDPDLVDTVFEFTTDTVVAMFDSTGFVTPGVGSTPGSSSDGMPFSKPKSCSK